MSLSHDDLAALLSAHLRGPDRMTWCDIQLGASGSARPDVYTINKSFVRPTPLAYECKVSRADFLADVTTGKWQSYLKYACGVYFACEAGLLTKADVPQHCGLMVFTPTFDGEGRWRAAKKAVLSPVAVPEHALLKLLIDGVQREGPTARLKQWSGYVEQMNARKRFGEVAGAVIQDRLKVEMEIKRAREQVEHIEAGARHHAEQVRKEAADSVVPMRSELCAALGLPTDADRYQIQAEIRSLRDALKRHPAVAQLEQTEICLRRLLAQVESSRREHDNVEAIA